VPGLTPRGLPSLALACFVLAVALDGVLATTAGSRAPAWAHWCSPSALRAASHGVNGAGRLGVAVLTPVEALLPHWPHFLPILLGLATLVYLRRANAR
jgi:hypothetical protein